MSIRLRRSSPLFTLLLLLVLTACGQQTGAVSTPTTAVVAPTTPPGTPIARSAAPVQSPSPTTAARQVSPTPSTGSSSTIDPSRITLGKPVFVSNGARVVVAVQTTNTSDRYVNVTIKPKLKEGAKPPLGVTGAVNDVPPGGTRTALLITDETTAKGYDLLDAQVSNVLAIPGEVASNLAQRIRLGQPVVAIDGSRSTVAVDITSENPKRVSYYVRLVFVKDGVITATAGAEMESQPNVTKQTSFVIDGNPAGATIQTEISRVVER